MGCQLLEALSTTLDRASLALQVGSPVGRAMSKLPLRSANSLHSTVIERLNTDIRDEIFSFGIIIQIGFNKCA